MLSLLLHRNEYQTKEHLVSNKKIPQLNIRRVNPMTENQSRIFEAFGNGQHLFITGSAGTGKTFVSLYLALNEKMNKPVYNTDIYDITIVRSAVPTRDIGFLPGDLAEKTAIYEQPYRDIVDNLYERVGMYDSLKANGEINFLTTSFMRGLTIDHSIVIVDETQNMNVSELSTIITRLGPSSRIIFCGDFFQTDLERERERNGLVTFMKILSEMEEFDLIEMTENDIVRSGIAKSFIMHRNHIESNRSIDGVFANAVSA